VKRTLLCAMLMAFGLNPGFAANTARFKEGTTVIEFGKTHTGQPVQLYTLDNGKGMIAKITNYGATLTQLMVPDRHGNTANVVLGFDNLEQYLGDHSYLGVIVGRYANRIAKGIFTLEGKTYHLALNAGPHHLHGGPTGFASRVWKAEGLSTKEGPAVKLEYTSADGEEGFPGKLTLTVLYTLTHGNELKIEYTATTDKTTVVNPTNHAYFNLAGAGSGTVMDHELMITAEQVTAIDAEKIPTGEITSVKGTALDFTKPVTVGSRIASFPEGFDHNYVLGLKPSPEPVLAARVVEPKSGRIMEILTTEPGIQFYSAWHMNGSIKGIGGAYVSGGALCLETQHFPDSPNHPNFPTTTLEAGKTFHSLTIHRFSAK